MPTSALELEPLKKKIGGGSESQSDLSRIAYIEARVLSLTGILDISNTKINGADENLTLGEFEIPVLVVECVDVWSIFESPAGLMVERVEVWSVFLGAQRVLVVERVVAGSPSSECELRWPKE